MEKKLKYIITSIQEYKDGTKKAFLTRICDNIEDARTLLQRIYEDAENNRAGRYATLSNPKWLDDKHNTLQVTSTTRTSWVHMEVTETYCLSDDWTTNIYDKALWISY
jgi:hypothetical protein